MARHESDREDLLREATALVERIELARGGQSDSEPIVAGFRRDGSLSIYFGADPVYQFNTAHELRRAFAGGRLFKAMKRRLVRLERVRQHNEVQLVRRELGDSEQAAFVTQMRCHLNDLADNLNAGHLNVVGQVPANVDILSRVRQWLASHDGLPIAHSPHVQAKHN